MTQGADVPGGRAPAEEPVVVLESIPEPRRTTNPYLVQLLRALPADVRPLTFSWRRALLGSYDVMHVHWPEHLQRGTTPLRTARRRVLTVLLLVRLGLRGIPLVRTLHNASPHEPGDRVERLLLRWFDRRTRVWIRLTPTTAVPGRGAVVTIPHGHYRDWFAGMPVPEREPGRIAFVGLLRPYKGVEELLDAFRSLPDPSLRLRVVGRPSDDVLRDRVTRAASTDERIGIRLEYVDDATLADEIGRAELVVLPYRRLQNSGVALLALSLGRPVLLPAGTTSAELAAEVGAGWVTTFEGPVTGTDLRAALEQVRRCDRGAPPDLDARDWHTAGEAHGEAFRAALADRAARRAPRLGQRDSRRTRGETA